MLRPLPPKQGKHSNRRVSTELGAVQTNEWVPATL